MRTTTTRLACLVTLTTAFLVPSNPPAHAVESNGPDIDVTNVVGHLEALQGIADANGGHRAHGSPGYNESVDHIKALLPILEVALRLAAAAETPAKHVRFAWWGAEELGLVGSSRYVQGLSSTERAQIDAYYNVDMVGSPNPGYFVYDGDDSDGTGSGPGPEGSAYLEQVLVDYFDGIGVPTRGTDFDGRSDYGPFIQYGVPAGGTFTGAEDWKTSAEVQPWGGTTGPFDPCYHSSCDDLDNVDATALDRSSDAIAHAVWTVAHVG